MLQKKTALLLHVTNCMKRMQPKLAKVIMFFVVGVLWAQ